MGRGGINNASSYYNREMQMNKKNEGMKIACKKGQGTTLQIESIGTS